MTCDQTLSSSDAICECSPSKLHVSPRSPPQPSPPPSAPPTMSPSPPRPSLPPPSPSTPSPSPPPSKPPASGVCKQASCTSEVLGMLAGEYTCGDRISWLQTFAGGSFSEDSACSRVAGEFPEECGGCATCDEAMWPNKDKDLTCGSCKVLVDRFAEVYGTCNGYCSSINRQCAGAWEEVADTCAVSYAMTCDQTLSSSDAICECSPSKLRVSPPPLAPPTTSPSPPRPATSITSLHCLNAHCQLLVIPIESKCSWRVMTENSASVIA